MAMERQLSDGGADVGKVVGEHGSTTFFRLSKFGERKHQNTKPKSGNERYRNGRTATFGSQVEVQRGQVSPEYYLKIVVLGAPSSGKTSLVQRYVQQQQQQQPQQRRRTQTATAEEIHGSSGALQQRKLLRTSPTIGIGVHTCSLRRNKKILRRLQIPVRIKLFDVPHAELTGKHLSTIFHDAHGVIIMFDVTDIRSIKAVDLWRAVLPASVADNVLLCAHKCDRRFSRHIISPTGLDAYVRDGGYVGWHMTTAKSESSSRIAIDYLVDRSLRQMLHKFQKLPVESARLHMVRSTPRESSHGISHQRDQYQYLSSPGQSLAFVPIPGPRSIRQRTAKSNIDGDILAGSFLSPSHRNFAAPLLHKSHNHSLHISNTPSSSSSSFSPSEITDDTTDHAMQVIGDMDDDMMFHQHHHQSHCLRAVVEEMETNPFIMKETVDGRQNAQDSSDSQSSVSTATTSSSSSKSLEKADAAVERTTVAANLNADIHKLVRNSSDNTANHSQTGTYLQKMLVPLAKKQKTVSLFIEEVKVFFVQVKARFTEYLEFVKNNDQLFGREVAVRNELIHLIIEECAEQETSLMKTLSIVLTTYSEQGAGTISEDLYMRRIFIEQKRKFYMDMMNKWMSLWQSFKMEMTLHELAGCRLLPLETCIQLLEQFRKKAQRRKSKEDTDHALPTSSMPRDGSLSPISKVFPSSDYYYRFRFASLNDFFEINDESMALRMLNMEDDVSGMYRPHAAPIVTTRIGFTFQNRESD